MKIRNLIASLAATGFTLAAATAFAADAPKFDDVDANKDGKVSQDEAATVPGLDFASADTDKDGMLSRTEYMKAVS